MYKNGSCPLGSHKEENIESLQKGPELWYFGYNITVICGNNGINYLKILSDDHITYTFDV